MDNWKYQKLKLSSLRVNKENPRFEIADSQREAIQNMIEDQKNKLYKLAKDILSDGLNPSDITMVCPHPDLKTKFVVLEGNRRITALKILETPDLIPENYRSLRKKFRELNVQFLKNPIAKINCVVFQHKIDSKKWVELKHTGANEGVGTVGWDAQQSARFKGDSITTQAIDFLYASETIDDSLKGQLPKLKSSSLKRLLDDPDARNFLGIKKEDGRLKRVIDKEEVEKGLVRMVTDLLKPKFTVKEIYLKEDRLDYLSKVPKKYVPDLSKKFDTPIRLSDPDSSATVAAKKAKPKSARTVPLSTKRKTLIPKSFKIKVTDAKTNKIYKELLALEVDKFENAAAVLMRVFVELSVDAFVSSNKSIKGAGKWKSLRDKIKQVIVYMHNKKIATKHELKGIEIAVQNDHSLISIDTFNSYVHNKHINPISKELKLSWDRIQVFIEILWNNL